MLTIVWQSQFKRDFKNAKKRKRRLEKLAYIIEELQHSKKTPSKE